MADRETSKRSLARFLEGLREDVLNDRLAYLHVLVSYTDEGGRVRNANWHHEAHVADKSEEELLRDLALLRISFRNAEDQLMALHDEYTRTPDERGLSVVVEDETP